MTPKSLKIYSIFLGLLFVAGFLCFFVTGSENQAAAKSLETKQGIAELEKIDQFSEYAAGEKKSLSSFEQADGIRQLKGQVLESGSFLSVRKRLEHFQRSDIDTAQNASAAEQIILRKYSNHGNEDEVTRRVLALYLLRYSKYLSENSCLTLIDSLVDQYEGASVELSRRAIRFDIGSIAYNCARINSDLFSKKIDGLDFPSLKAQANNAIAVYEEESRDD